MQFSAGDPRAPPLTGVFFKRWHEVCGVGQEKLMPRITRAHLADMLRTVRLPFPPRAPPLTPAQRIVYTPLLATSFVARPKAPAAPDVWAAPAWTPAFLEVRRPRAAAHTR